MVLNIELLYQTLARLLSEDKDYEVTFEISRKEDDVKWDLCVKNQTVNVTDV